MSKASEWHRTRIVLGEGGLTYVGTRDQFGFIDAGEVATFRPGKPINAEVYRGRYRLVLERIG